MQERHDDTRTCERWTPRQRQVLDLIAAGRTNAQIADELGISLPGAKWHVSEIISKLGVASREEVAAYWLDGRRPVARAGRFLRALLAPAALKWAGASAGMVTAAAGAMFVAAPLFASGDGAAQVTDPTPTPSPSAVFSQAEAEAVARRLAQELVFDAYPAYLAPDQAAVDARPVLASDGVAFWDFLHSGRRLGAADLEVTASSFVKGATEAESNITGTTEILDGPTDTWLFTFALRPAEKPDTDFDPDVRIAFEDGTGRVLFGGQVGSNFYQGTLPDGATKSSAVRLATFEHEGVTFVLWGENGDFSWRRAQPGLARDFAWCLSETDSRMPGTSGGTCGNDAPAPITVATFQSQKFAQAYGLVAPEVAKVRAVTEDGRELVVEPGPQPEPADFPWRGYVVAAPGSAWFVTVEALDAQGNVIGSRDFSNHPANPTPVP